MRFASARGGAGARVTATGALDGIRVIEVGT